MVWFLIVTTGTDPYMKKKHNRALRQLRKLRRTWGLTQDDMAKLVGSVTALQISRYETSKRAPNLEVALAYQVIFGVPPASIFPDTYALVEETVIRNMAQMDLALANTSSPFGMRKRELFALAMDRATGYSASRRRA